MDCPRCNGTVTHFQLDGRESLLCERCGYVGIIATHESTKQPTESWDDVLRRYGSVTQTKRVEADRHQTVLVADTDTPEEAPIVSDTLRSTLAEQLPGRGDTLTNRIDAVGSLYAVLQQQGTAQRNELLDAISVSDVGYASLDSFWSNCGQTGLKLCPGIMPPKPGEKAWTYDPETAADQ